MNDPQDLNRPDQTHPALSHPDRPAPVRESHTLREQIVEVVEAVAQVELDVARECSGRIPSES